MAIIAVGRALQFVDLDPDAAHDVYCKHELVPWAYYQIYIIGNAGDVFSATYSKGNR